MTDQRSQNGLVVCLVRDLFFGVRLKQLGADLGFDVTIVSDAKAFRQACASDSVALGVIDINASPDWEAIAGVESTDSTPPILAFGPHLDVDGLRSAKAAGVTRVVSNGQFHREAAILIQRYARTIS